jgi:hypothetical protein
MRAVAILALIAIVFGDLACNSEATVCPQPGLCDNGQPDSAGDADAASDAQSDAPIDVPGDASTDASDTE